jgi:hypothetical protein
VKKTLSLLLLALAVSCSRSSSSSSAAAGAAAAPAAPALRQAKDLLADEKVVAGYAVYQKEMAPHAKQAMDIFTAAYAKAGGDAKKLEAATKDDPRIIEYNKLNEAALAKAGISDEEMRTLSRALSDYLASVYVAQDAADAAAQRKAAEDKLVAAFGSTALANVKKHEPDLLAAQQAALDGATGK